MGGNLPPRTGRMRTRGRAGCAVALAMMLASPLSGLAVPLLRALGADGQYFKPMADLVVPHNYPLEEHFAYTSDGCILRMFRIPHGVRHPAAEEATAVAAAPRRERPLVFLQHPLMDSSTAFVIQGPQRGLAFLLSDAGFDVWMGNVRGNRFSFNHTRLQPHLSNEYGAYSWDEHALLDLPAMISKALLESGQAQLSYVGYSQGATMGLGLLSTQPTVARRVRLAVLLAPVAFATAVSSPIFRSSVALRAESVLGWMGHIAAHRLLLNSAAVMEGQCARRPQMCLDWMLMLCGRNPNVSNVDPHLMSRVVPHLAAGTSAQNMLHWAQGVRSSEPSVLRRLDLGTRCASLTGRRRPCNQRKYGQHVAPAYNLTAIRTPLAIFTGGRDSLSHPLDVQRLLRALSPGVVVEHHELADYGHLDFGFGEDAHARLFPRVLDLLRDHSGARNGAHHARSSPFAKAASAAAELEDTADEQLEDAAIAAAVASLSAPKSGRDLRADAAPPGMEDGLATLGDLRGGLGGPLAAAAAAVGGEVGVVQSLATADVAWWQLLVQ